MGSIYENNYFCPKCWRTVNGGRQKKRLWPKTDQTGKPIDYGSPQRCPICKAFLRGEASQNAQDNKYNFEGDVQITVFAGTKL